MEVGAGTSMSPYDTGTTLVEICLRIEAYQSSYQLPLNQVQPIFLKEDQCQPHDDFWTGQHSLQVVK